MVNLEHKLTVDDLIVEYMMYKVKNGYQPSFLASEFINFLYFFESKMPVEDTLYESDKLFQRFFERKSKSDWSRTINFKTYEKESTPHMEMTYSKKDNDHIIKANYKLSNYDRSVINTYFMDNGMGRYDGFKGQVFEIRKIIEEYLLTQSKRQIDETVKIDNDDLIVGKYVAGEIITSIWENYISTLIEKQNWPRQCNDINKYLFEIDLASIIGVKSIKDEIIDLYNVFSKRIAILYHQDKNLQIRTSSSAYLARANYDLLIQGYEEIMKTTFDAYRKSLDIDLSVLMSKGTSKIDGVDEIPNTKTNIDNFEKENAKKFVLSLNK